MATESEGPGGRGIAQRRRKRNAGGARPHRTVIRHTDEEWARVTAMAAHLGVSVPGLYERALFAGSAQSAVALEEVVLGMLGARRLLANAANNLNQVARAVNFGDGVNVAQLDYSLRTFERAIDELRSEIDNLHRFVPQPEDDA
ncbi:hypothetical protein [Nocardioides pacificus]